MLGGSHGGRSGWWDSGEQFTHPVPDYHDRLDFRENSFPIEDNVAQFSNKIEVGFKVLFVLNRESISVIFIQ